jgi:adenylate cyclase
VRIGIHAGPVVETEGRYVGAALNVAARVTALARAGQILCTEPVTERAREMLDVQFRSLGPARLRHISEPVQLFEVVVASGEATATAVDPVCRMRVAPGSTAARVVLDSVTYHFCSKDCAERFSRQPGAYLER